MPKLPVISGGEAVRALQKAAWRFDRQRGGHVILIKQGKNVTLSFPSTAKWRQGLYVP
jgi:predicted RNA binding protein YcfA (HicA-like mRNA interferase family)